MKKIAFLLLANVLILGCKPIERVAYIPVYEEIIGLDFRPFAEKDFLFTPYSYSGKYTTIALIDFKIIPSATLDTILPSINTTGHATTYKWISDTIQTDIALERIYQHCIGMGADALVDFVIEEVTMHYPLKPIANLTGKRITRLAIR